MPQLATAGAGDVLAGRCGGAQRARAAARARALAGGGRARLGSPARGLRAGGDRRDRPAAAARAPARVSRSTRRGRPRRAPRERAQADRRRGRERGLGGREGRRLRPRSASRAPAPRWRRARRASAARRSTRRASCARRSATPSPIIVLSPLDPGEEAHAAGFDIVVSSREDYARLRAAGAACACTSRPTRAWAAGAWLPTTRSRPAASSPTGRRAAAAGRAHVAPGDGG